MGQECKNKWCTFPFKSYDFIYHNYCVYSNKTDIYWTKKALNSYWVPTFTGQKRLL